MHARGVAATGKALLHALMQQLQHQGHVHAQGGSLQLARDACSMAGCNGGADLAERLANTHASLMKYFRRDEPDLAAEE